MPEPTADVGKCDLLAEAKQGEAAPSQNDIQAPADTLTNGVPDSTPEQHPAEEHVKTIPVEIEGKTDEKSVKKAPEPAPHTEPQPKPLSNQVEVYNVIHSMEFTPLSKSAISEVEDHLFLQPKEPTLVGAEEVSSSFSSHFRSEESRSVETKFSSSTVPQKVLVDGDAAPEVGVA